MSNRLSVYQKLPDKIRNMLLIFYSENYLDLEFYKLQIFWQLKHNKKRISLRDIPFICVITNKLILIILI